MDPYRLKLRPATTADRDYLYDLHCATMRAYVEATWGWNEADQRSRFDAGFDPTSNQIVEVDGSPVGVLTVERQPAGINLSKIEIHPTFQRRGIGTLLVRGLLAEASGRGQPVTLRVLKINPARRLYERLGFHTVGETPTHVHMYWDSFKAVS